MFFFKAGSQLTTIEIKRHSYMITDEANGKRDTFNMTICEPLEACGHTM